ncbi:MAG: cation diffusion facilitator family transporter [Gemmataceae bacterium]
MRVSMCGYLFMAALGIGFAWLTQSQAILLDGVYSLVSFVMAMLASRVVKLVDLPESDTFHFGFAHFEPWLNAVRGLLILVLCSFAFFSAVSSLFHGGRELKAGIAVIYGIVAALGCVSIASLQYRNSRRANSPVLAVDARNWMIDGVLSGVVGIAFVASWLLQGAETFRHWIPYVDPLLVSVLVIAMSPVPFRMFFDNLKEVFFVAPDSTSQTEIRNKVESAVQDLPARKVNVRMVKIGRFAYLFIHVVVEEDYTVGSVKQLDDIRQRIYRSLDVSPLRLVTDIVFTCQENWMWGLEPPKNESGLPEDTEK